MALTVTAKVTNIQNLAEARFCAGMGVEIVSFQLGDSGLSIDEAAGIAGWLAGIKVCIDTENLSDDFLIQSLEILQPDYLSVSETLLSNWNLNSDHGFILILNETSLSEIQTKIKTFTEKADYFEITYHPEWISDQNHDLFIELSNNSRVIISYKNLDELDELFRTGKIFRAISISKNDFNEDEFRQAIEMFEEMD